MLENIKYTTFFIQTYGCAMNYADSDSIRKFMNEAGSVEVDKYQSADVVIINSCSIRGQAEDKISGWGIKAKKTSIKSKLFVLTGCMAQRFDRKNNELDKKYARKIVAKFPWIDILVANSDLDEIPELVANLSSIGKKSSKKKINETSFSSSIIGKDSDSSKQYMIKDRFQQNSSDRYRGVFPISVGCDNFCSYCIVPFSRGKLQFRTVDSIVKDVTDFVNKGGKIVTLAGQNVNNWRGFVNGRKIEFADLLEKVCKIEGDFWITFISSNPMDFTDRLIEIATTYPKVMKYLNIAVQSGSERILKLMNRKYTLERFNEIVTKLKEKSEGFRVTTDIIVGFPSETLDDFAKSLGLIKELGIEMVYVGKYSPREGTVSSKLEETCSADLKDSREREINEVINRTRLEKHKSLVGSVMRVLAIGGKRGFSYYGHEVNFTETVKGSMIGKFVDIEVVGASRAGVVGQIKDKR